VSEFLARSWASSYTMHKFRSKKMHPSFVCRRTFAWASSGQESCIDGSLPRARLPGIGQSRRYPDSKDPLAFDGSNWYTPRSRFVSPRCGRGFEMARQDSGERLGFVGMRGSPLDSLLSADESPLGRWTRFTSIRSRLRRRYLPKSVAGIDFTIRTGTTFVTA
jgi:hypothetical protein